MSVKVLVAEGSEVVRRAIRWFLQNRPGIVLVGEAENVNEAVVKSQQLRPDVVVFDLRLAEGCDEPIQSKSIFGVAKLLAISFGTDDDKALAERIGVESFTDKMKLSEELIPAILELARVDGQVAESARKAKPLGAGVKAQFVFSRKRL